MNEHCKKLYDIWIKGWGMYAHQVYSSEAFEAGWKAHEKYVEDISEEMFIAIEAGRKIRQELKRESS